MSKPLRSGDQEEQELELLEESYADRSVEAQQQERLLTKESQADNGESGLERPRSKPWTWRAWLLVFALLVAGIAMSAIAVLGLSREAEEARHEVAEALGVQPNDYVLDSKWDSAAAPRRREFHWVVRDQVHNPDGVFRPMILVNNMFPGPLVEANDGDTIVVHVENRAVNATSIHFHGLYQNGTPHMDGTVGVTQCPIAPGGSFTYEFNIRGQHGTTWWHGHQGVQTSDGLHGPVVIHARHESDLQQIPYDSDRVILLSDHYHDLSAALMFQYLMPDRENEEPVPESGLVNGRGIRDCDDYPNRKCDNTTSNVGFPNIVLDRDKTHRLRIVNVGAFADFQFQIDEHELAVTEVDGTDVHPRSYHRLDINPGQRYSVVISSNASSADSFWMRARMIITCFKDPPSTLDPIALAVVRYDDIPTLDQPSSPDWEEKLAMDCRDMNTTELVPVEAVAAPAEPDAVFYIRANFEIGAYRLSRGLFNRSSWRPNARSPTLMRAIDGLRTGNHTFSTAQADDPRSPPFVNTAAFHPDRELVIQTTGIQTVDVLVSNFDDGNHPLHLHGHRYFVLAQGHGAPPVTDVAAAIDRASLAPLYQTLDLSNPLRRDTASVEGYGWILIRIIADNPGVWAFHCHVSWHTEAGLLMQFLTRADELARMEIPPESAALCAAEGVEKGMALDDADYEVFAK